MAQIIPSDLTRAALAGAKSPELETLRLLKDALPSDYTVFHGIHCTREYEAWTHFGEIDFIVLDPPGAVLLIEQKNGALEEAATGLAKHYEDSSKNLAQQVNRAVGKVLDKFHWQHGREAKLEIDYLVFLPDHRLKNVNAVGLDADRIVDATARDRLATQEKARVRYASARSRADRARSTPFTASGGSSSSPAGSRPTSASPTSRASGAACWSESPAR
jgi:hypothetical protein